MSLSELCVEQYEREQSGLRKLLMLGLVGSVGVHVVAFGVGTLGLWQRNADAEMTPIELLVMEPPPEPIEEPEEIPEEIVEEPTPAELSAQANDPAPAAPEAAPVAAAPEPAQLIEPEPEPPEPEALPDTEAESELEEPEDPESSDAEDEEDEEEQEIATAPEESDLDSVRRLLQEFGNTSPNISGDRTLTGNDTGPESGDDEQQTATGP
ncbi:MAG: hypothetical protein AAGF66_11080, partial [Cyanobacteria bacterium P01_H01_bin.119]